MAGTFRFIFRDTNFIVQLIAERFHGLGAKPVLDFYGFIDTWNKNHNADGIPENRNLKTIVDKAVMVVNAMLETSREVMLSENRKKATGKADGGQGTGGNADSSVWVLVSRLEPPRIPSVKARKRYIEEHKNEIRSRRPLTKSGKFHPKRLEVHVGDWIQHWGKTDRQAFDNLDNADPSPITSDGLTDDFMDGATKLYTDIFKGNCPRP